MYAITGITGRVGGQVATELLDAGCAVRAVLRDASKAPKWVARGCEIAIASMDDATALTTAFDGADAVFVLLPPVFDPSPDFPETRRNVAALVRALKASQPGRVVCLSTIGAQAEKENLLTQLQIMERAFGSLDMPVAFLRAAWFIENVEWDIDIARRTGTIPSFLQPIDRPIPMVATADVARTAVRLLRDPWDGQRIVELEGRKRVSPANLASALADVLGRDVHAEPVLRDTWDALFRSQGMTNPIPRMRMLDGFNEGWIEFESRANRSTETTDAAKNSTTALRGQTSSRKLLELSSATNPVSRRNLIRPGILESVRDFRRNNTGLVGPFTGLETRLALKQHGPAQVEYRGQKDRHQRTSRGYSQAINTANPIPDQKYPGKK